jgi:HSP20 family molecular chaperone IbpA
MGGQKSLNVVTYNPFSLFDVFDDFFNSSQFYFPSWIDKSYSSALPTNVYHEKDKKDLNFEIAVAGYEMKDISIDYDRDFLVIKVLSDKEKDVTTQVNIRDYIKRTLRYSSCEMKHFVPEDFYDQEKTKASIENGILKIFVPALEKKRNTKRIEIAIK